MAWCCQATSHYLSLDWHRFMLPYGVVTKPQQVNTVQLNMKFWRFTHTHTYKYIYMLAAAVGSTPICRKAPNIRSTSGCSPQVYWWPWSLSQLYKYTFTILLSRLGVHSWIHARWLRACGKTLPHVPSKKMGAAEKTCKICQTEGRRGKLWISISLNSIINDNCISI